jgi:hypothetical protein
MSSTDDGQRKNKRQAGGTANPSRPFIPMAPSLCGRTTTWSCLIWLQDDALLVHSSDTGAQSSLEVALATNPTVQQAFRELLRSYPLQSPALDIIWEYCQTFYLGESPAPISAAQILFPIEDLQASLTTILPPGTQGAPDATSDAMLVAECIGPSGRTDAAVFKELVLRRNVIYPLPVQPRDTPHPQASPREPTTEGTPLEAQLPACPAPDGTPTDRGPEDQEADEDLAVISSLLDAQSLEEMYAIGATSSPPAEALVAERATYFRLMTAACADILDEAIADSLARHPLQPHSNPDEVRAAILRHAYAAWRRRRYPCTANAVEDSVSLGIELQAAMASASDSHPTSGPS